MICTGTYKKVNDENYEPFMQTMGLPKEMIEKGKDMKSTIKIEQKGDGYEITIIKGKKIICNTLTPGIESEFELPTGNKVTVTPVVNGNKIELKVNNNFKITIECSGDTLVNTMEVGKAGEANNIVYKSVYNKESKKAE